MMFPVSSYKPSDSFNIHPLMTRAEGEFLNRFFLGHTNMVFIFSSLKILPKSCFFSSKIS